MKINRKEKVLFYTNFFIILPLIFSIYQKNIVMSALIGTVFIFSGLFHLFKKSGSEWWWNTKGRSREQTLFLIVEIALSTILAFLSIFFLFKNGQPLTILLALLIFVPSFILYLSTNYKKYILYHSIWHFSSSVIIFIALI